MPRGMAAWAKTRMGRQGLRFGALASELLVCVLRKYIDCVLNGSRSAAGLLKEIKVLARCPGGLPSRCGYNRLGLWYETVISTVWVCWLRHCCCFGLRVGLGQSFRCCWQRFFFGSFAIRSG